MDAVQTVTSVETLEEAIVDTVEDAEEAIVDTVETAEGAVVDTVEDPEEVIVDTVETAEGAVVDTVEDPEEVMVDTVEIAEGAVVGTVEDPETASVDTAETLVKATVDTAEALAEEDVEPADTEDTEVLDQALADTSEMGELPVEDWDYQRPRRGEVRPGIILSIGEQEIVVDVGAKRDGIVPFADMQRMGAEALAVFSVGDEVPVYIMRPEDQDGNLLVSLFLARQTQAWTRAQEMADKGEVWEEQVIGFNKGGLVVPVGEIRGFVPASQVPGFPLGLDQEERITRLSSWIGETLQVKVIEINRRKRRLILSATAAQRQWRKRQRERLLSELREGEVRKGVVTSLASFGAFVDLGGADGLVHLSELSWRRIRHPREAVKVGEEVEVYVLRLDHEKKRIGLSLKRLQPEPWAMVEDKYELGQLVEGVVTNAVDFGAFAEIDEGVEGLIHVSELSDAPISHPREVVKKDDLLLLRIIRIDVRRKRLGLSLKRVLESEWAEWAARLALAEAEKKAAAEEAEPTVAQVAEEPAKEFVAAVADSQVESQEPAELEALSADEEAAPEAAVLEEPEEVEEPAEPELFVDEEAAPEAAVLEEPEEVEEPAEPELSVEEEAAPEAAVLEEPEEVEEPAEPELLVEEEAAVLEEPEEAEESAEPELSVEEEAAPEAAVLEEPEEVEEPAEPAPSAEAEAAPVAASPEGLEETETISALSEAETQTPEEAETSEQTEPSGEEGDSSVEDPELATMEA